MSRIFFARELEAAVTFWRIFRRDGVALGFISHDRDLTFDGICHRAAPGMVPSAIRLTSGLSDESADVQGVLTHSAINSADLASGRFDAAAVQIGIVDWETLERTALYHGLLGTITADGGSFSAELSSAKSVLNRDFVPRTSPTCRARFCGPGCSLSAPEYSLSTSITAIDLERNAVTAPPLDSPPDLVSFLFGELRWFDGPHAGIRMQIVDLTEDGLVLDQPLSPDVQAGTAVRLKQGCDHTFITCQSRFGNAINFQGEPFLPGNDLLARYPLPQ